MGVGGAEDTDRWMASLRSRLKHLVGGAAFEIPIVGVATFEIPVEEMLLY